MKFGLSLFLLLLMQCLYLDAYVCEHRHHHDQQVLAIKDLEVERLSFLGGVYRYPVVIDLTFQSIQPFNVNQLEQITALVLGFLTDYTYTPAMWELVNKDMVLCLVRYFPEIEAITSRIHVTGTPRRPYNRWTMTRYLGASNIEEAFGFSCKLHFAKGCYQFEVNFIYKPQESSNHYIEFIGLIDEMQSWLYQQPSEANLSAELLKPCCEMLMQKYPSLAHLELALDF